MDEHLQIRRFDELPSPEVFASQIEPRNVPAVFHGCTKDWKAFSKWSPSNGGLDYLQDRVGSSVVEAMFSRSAPVFYGDIRSHERVPLPFSTFIASCKMHQQDADDAAGVCVQSDGNGYTGSYVEQTCAAFEDAPHQVYLAQPTILELKELASINLWMNNSQSRSSTHYDPHNNLLCIVAGCKQVVLWPPSASSLLYPMSIYGEASNHSSVDLENPDFFIHSRAKYSTEYSQKVILHAGDALFIPEGWFHQVNSDKLTIAVNFWWRSNMMSNMLEHMDSYYLRRILRRLVDKEMNRMLHRSSVGHWKPENHMLEQPSNGEAGNFDYHLDKQSESKDLKEKSQREVTMLNQLEPLALQALHELVSLVHDSVELAGQNHPVDSASDNSGVSMKEIGHQKIVTADKFNLEDDPIANILWPLEPLMLHNIFMVMVHNFPRTLEALILHMLSPVGAEVLTQKFDDMDKQITKEEQNKFYQAFYGVFDDQFAAMNAILNGKESFAHQAFRNVLDLYLGVTYDGCKLPVR
ncbi:PREDICTED: uncharacterized protein LOC104613224 isoform X2 [Nelumbo nucifera]|uniref:Uncharacterized protein LOC104613224 isoform X2 n=1 Tax=Nelumbo nucifera TaxID=4432 RepID=A0A1U8BP45_NELNU|nr:PREDICTED: uncharacterized protein LOC104613224 isoform X2 [Nelumbo nucifera]